MGLAVRMSEGYGQEKVSRRASSLVGHRKAAKLHVI
jgi:hypothetical protein